MPRTKLIRFYDKPLFSGSSANVSYRPKPVALDDDIAGSTNGASASLTGRAKPIEFEREADPFGLSALFEDASSSKQCAPADLVWIKLVNVGKWQQTQRAAGRTAADRAEDEVGNRQTNQRKMDFVVAATESTSIGTLHTVHAGLRLSSAATPSTLPPASSTAVDSERYQRPRP